MAFFLAAAELTGWIKHPRDAASWGSSKGLAAPRGAAPGHCDLVNPRA